MPVISRTFEFDAGHRVLRHESKCAYPHGHRYRMEVEVHAPELDSLGRVIDFGELKTIVGGWIDKHWDHNQILNRADPLLHAILPRNFWYRHPELAGKTSAEVLAGGPKTPYIMGGPLSGRDINPTAENMAMEAAECLTEVLQEHTSALTIRRIRLWETPNCWAEVNRRTCLPDTDSRCFHFV